LAILAAAPTQAAPARPATDLAGPGSGTLASTRVCIYWHPVTSYWRELVLDVKKGREMSYQQQNWPAPPRDKSVGAALVLTFLFGPLGLFYVGAGPGLIGLFILLPLAIIGGIVTFGVLSVVVWLVSMLWAALRAGKAHSAFQVYLARGARWS
jgi:hypothetical protein